MPRTLHSHKRHRVPDLPGLGWRKCSTDLCRGTARARTLASGSETVTTGSNAWASRRPGRDSLGGGGTSPPADAACSPGAGVQGTCWKYLSPLMYSLSCESCSLLVFTYCHRAWTMAERLCVCSPSSRARRGSSLNWGGWGKGAHGDEGVERAQAAWDQGRGGGDAVIGAPQERASGEGGQRGGWAHSGCVPGGPQPAQSKRKGVGVPGPLLPGVGAGTDLVVQHEEQRAAHTEVPRPLNLEPVRLLGGGRPVPLPAGRELGHVPGPSGLLGPGALGRSLRQICAADGTPGLGPVEGWLSPAKRVWVSPPLGGCQGHRGLCPAQ